MSKEIHVTKWLALRLSDWHTSMSDPVYAVSSSGLANRRVPREVFEAAMGNMQAAAADPEHESRSSAVEIFAEMRAILGLVEPEQVATTIALSLSRTLWASVWGDEAEEQGESTSGLQLIHAAPDTPASCLNKANELLAEILVENKFTAEEFFMSWKFDVGNEYNFGDELAAAMLGFSDLDFEKFGGPWIPSIEIGYYDFKKEWEPT